MTERRYGEEEVALILHRAVEAAATDQESGAGAGLTLAELKETGAEAGIDASRIEVAAKGLAIRRDDPATPSSTGFPPTEQLERVSPETPIRPSMTICSSSGPTTASSRSSYSGERVESVAAERTMLMPGS